MNCKEYSSRETHLQESVDGIVFLTRIIIYIVRHVWGVNASFNFYNVRFL